MAPSENWLDVMPGHNKIEAGDGKIPANGKNHRSSGKYPLILLKSLDRKEAIS
jgi:hypothetical protein